MPRCCVLSCGRIRDEDNPRLTFHNCPKNESLRQKWIDVIGSRNINLNVKNIIICSLHFEESCINKTMNATRLQDNAVPSLHLQPEPARLRMADSKLSDTQTKSISNIETVCRICLSIKNKLFCLRSYKLTDAFELLTGQKLNFDDGLPQNLCAECATKIQNFYKFRNSIQKSHYYMLRMQVKHINLTEATFKNIDRKDIEEIGFTTLEKTLKIDKYDLDIKHTDLYEDVQTEYKTEIKPENESEEDSDEEITKFDDDNISDLDSIKIEKNSNVGSEVDLDSKNIEKINDIDSVVSEKISDVDNEISDKLIDIVNENNDEINDFNDDINDSSKTDRADFDSDDSLPLLVKKKRVKKPTRYSNQKLVLDEQLFTISDLSYEEKLMDLEKRKENEKYQQKRFKCTICYTGYSSQQSYDRHMIRHTDAAGEHECKICKIYFEKKSQLTAHSSRSHNEVIRCNDCGFVTNLRRAAKLHEEWHRGKKYVCPHCKEEFIKYATYMAHVRIKHPSNHICQLCGYTYISEMGLKLHKLMAHKEDKFVVPEDGPVCEPCNVKFATEEAYQKHRSISHAINGKEKTINERCLSSFCNYPREVKARVKKSSTVVGVQTVKWPIPCEQCGILLANSIIYNGHFRKMHPGKNRTQYHGIKKPLMCDVCGRMFQNYTSLGAHRVIHTDVRNFKCDYCGKEFFMKMRLVAHLRTHDANRRRYCCVVCGKQFSSPSNRQKHMMRHSGQKPYKCELCDKSFYLPSDKKTHFKYTHMKVPWPRKKKDDKNKRRRLVKSLSKPNEQETNKDNEPSIQDGDEHNGAQRRKTRR